MARILSLYTDYAENEFCRIFPVQEFGALQITIMQPMRNEDGAIVRKKGQPVPDKSKTDTENIRLDQDVNTYFTQEVLPHIDPEAWIDFSKTRYLYEINFTRYFYKFQQQEPAADIAARIRQRQAQLINQLNAIFAQ